MTTRDRLMLLGVLALAIVVGGYLMVVAPERQKASKLSGEVQSARQALQSAETAAAEATSARSRYATEYASLVSIGPAVPASGEVPSLVYALASATNNRDVEFESITSSSSSSSSSSSGPSSHAASAGTTFSQEPFSFGFAGSFVDLYKLLDQLEGFTDQTSAGTLKVSGRLLTIDSVQLAGSESASGSSKSGLKATVDATAYVLPPGQSALGGATPSGPATGAATPASGGSTTSSPTSAAVIKAGP
ncbi:MAG TPA: type II secretion system protein GspM [Solirubrobacteraceae bacterium]|nr:type II secretion system protein GspM [Solirubrobacteraceae bacterium]